MTVTANKQANKQAFVNHLVKTVSREWVDNNRDIVDAWWKAPIVGGMFRAGVKYQKRKEKRRAAT